MEEVYENVKLTKPVRSVPVTDHRVLSSSKKKFYVAVIVFLGVLNVFLLVGLIVLGVHSRDLAGLASDLSTIKDNLTESFQTSKDKLSSMTEERDLLNTNLTEMTKELIRLQSLSKKDKTCPSGWRMLSCSCYFFSTKSGSWDEGREDCRNRGADLVVVGDADKQTILASVTDKSAWIGLTDKGKEGSWKWVDGTPVNFMSWANNQPDDGGGESLIEEDCAHIRTDDFWNDLPCTTSLQWICEKAPM